MLSTGSDGTSPLGPIVSMIEFIDILGFILSASLLYSDLLIPNFLLSREGYISSFLIAF